MSGVLEDASLSVSALGGMLQKVLANWCEVLFAETLLLLEFILSVGEATALFLLAVLALLTKKPEAAELSLNLLFPSVFKIVTGRITVWTFFVATKLRLVVFIIAVVVATLGRAISALGVEWLTVKVLLYFIHWHIIVIKHDRHRCIDVFVRCESSLEITVCGESWLLLFQEACTSIVVSEIDVNLRQWLLLAGDKILDLSALREGHSVMIAVHRVSMLESWLLGHKVVLTIDTWRFLEWRLLELLLVWHGEMLTTIIVHVWIFKVSVEAVLSLHISIWAVRLSGLHLWLFISYWRLEFLSIRWELSLNEAHFDLIEDFLWEKI